MLKEGCLIYVIEKSSHSTLTILVKQSHFVTLQITVNFCFSTPCNISHILHYSLFLLQGKKSYMLLLLIFAKAALVQPSLKSLKSFSVLNSLHFTKWEYNSTCTSCSSVSKKTKQKNPVHQSKNVFCTQSNIFSLV